VNITPIQPLETDGHVDDVSRTDSLIERQVRELLRMLGEDPTREGLAETPQRVRRAWREWTSGYRTDPRGLLKTFVDGVPSRQGRQLLCVRDIPVYSHCEHHLAPFFGTASVCYLPRERLVGLSKLPRLVEVFARRLQVQERLTEQIANALDEVLDPEGVGVLVKCRHLCMESRGVRARGTVTETSTFRGALKSDPTMRADFLRRTTWMGGE
jgi:GTP cyclohydrolase IA